MEIDWYQLFLLRNEKYIFKGEVDLIFERSIDKENE